MIKCNTLKKALMRDLSMSAPKAVRVELRSQFADILNGASPTLSDFQRIETILSMAASQAYIDDVGVQCAESIYFAARFFRKIDCGIYRSSNDEVVGSFSRRQSELEYEQMEDRVHSHMRRICRLLLGPLDSAGAASFRHGPGSVAEGQLGLDKSGVLFPSGLLEPARKLNFDPLQRLRVVDAPRSRTKITVVPKDWRGGRVIGMEPTWNMVLQQGVKSLLERRLSCVVPFYDQSVQQRILRSDIAQTLCTVDLSNASDHISVDAAHSILPAEWFHLMDSVRSPSHVLADGGIGRTNSFALMGNAFCFPLLSLVTLACALTAHFITYDISITDRYELVKACKRWNIVVFGDDLILPKEDVPALRYVMAQVGLKMSEDKCGFHDFREACGYFQFGTRNPITIPSIRSLAWTNDTQHGLVTLQNKMFRSGFPEVARCILGSCPSPLGVVQPTFPAATAAMMLDWDPEKTSPTRFTRRKHQVQSWLETTSERRVLLCDQVGWFASSHGGIPLTEPCGSKRSLVGWL